MSTVFPYERYERQVVLKEIGEVGQQKLLQSKVLVVGAGGLGCPALQYLAAAGIGTIGIVDDDVVSLTNLHRQVLYTTNDIGLLKAERAAFYLAQLNPEINVVPYCLRLTSGNALEIVSQYDIIVDGTDNFSSRYMINDACILLEKPLVYGAISKFEGQVAVLNSYHEDTGIRGANYRDLFPDIPGGNEILNCAEAGVLGVLPGIIGSMQANEVIKLVTGIGKPLIDRLLTYNALNCQVFEVALSLDDNAFAMVPKDAEAFRNTEYDWACSTGDPFDIEADEFSALLHNETVSLIDVREDGETPVVNQFPHLRMPLSRFKPGHISDYKGTIITFCQSGKRSLTAANILHGTFGDGKKIYSLRGGILAWMNSQK